jgi:YQGE family putative transporter
MAILNSDEHNLILVQGLWSLGDALAGIFVTIFIFAHSDFASALTYTGVNFCGLLFWYVCSGRLMEKISSGTMVRIGLSLNAILYLCLFLLRGDAVRYLIPLGFLDGTAAGIFWAGLNLNQYVHSQRHTRVHYFGTQSAINNGMQAAGPFIGGAIITLLGTSTILGYTSSYAALFLTTSLVYILGTVFIGKLPQHERLSFSFRKILTHKKSIAWKGVLWQHAAFGSFDALSGTVITVLVFTVVKGELLLGSARSVLAIITAIGALLATRILYKVKGGFWIGSVGVSLGILGFTAMPDIRGVWLFIFLYGITAAFLPTWLMTTWFHTLDGERMDWQQDYHIFIERECALDVPRILSYFLLIVLIRQGNQVQIAWHALYILPIFPILLGILFSIHAKKENKILPETVADI